MTSKWIWGRLDHSQLLLVYWRGKADYPPFQRHPICRDNLGLKSHVLEDARKYS